MMTRFLSVGALVAVGLLCVERPAGAQSNCKEAKGNVVDVSVAGSNTVSGTISNAGWLNGTASWVGTSGISFPLPNVLVFAGQLTITTNQGRLKINDVRTLDVSTFQGTSFGYIDPNASTGRFAGATGTLFLNLRKTTIVGSTGTFYSDLHGEVCFAGQ